MTENNCSRNRFGIQWKMSVVVVSFVLALIGCGEKKPNVYRVGILSGSDAFVRIADGFKEKMTELGYIEGKNIVYDVRTVNADSAAVRRIAKQFVEDKVDLILAFPTNPAVESKAAALDTGIPAISLTLDGLRLAAKKKGVILVEKPVTTVKEIEADLAKRAASDDIGMDAIFMMPTLLTVSPEGFGVINKFATEHELAVGGSMSYTADMGAIFSYAPVSFEVGKLVAPLAEKIFKGTSAGKIPVATAESRLRINYRRAQELGLTVPESLLSLATEIIH